MTFEQALALLERLGFIVALFLIYRSVPGHLINELITESKPYVEKTPTKIDDFLLSLGELLAGLQRETKPDSMPIQPIDTITFSSSEPPKGS